MAKASNGRRLRAYLNAMAKGNIFAEQVLISLAIVIMAAESVNTGSDQR